MNKIPLLQILNKISNLYLTGGGVDLNYLSVYISLSVHLGQFTNKGY